jgi:hypothetical protein
MASKTQVTEHRRKRKIHKRGKARKRAIRAKGSTPSAAKLFGDEK